MLKGVHLTPVSLSLCCSLEIGLFGFGDFFIMTLLLRLQYDDIDGRDPALFADADVRQLAMGGRRGSAPSPANVLRPGFRPQVLHRSAHPP